MAGREHRDPYVVLGVSRQASPEEIARAYRRAARASHPDSAGAASSARFRAINDAYGVLRDPGRRADYDRSQTGPPPARPGSVRYAAQGSQHVVLGRAPGEDAYRIVLSSLNGASRGLLLVLTRPNHRTGGVG
jgi:curved DNA-binding protein CbpA